MNKYLQLLKDAFTQLHDRNQDEALALLREAETAYDPNDRNLGVTKEDLYLTRGSIYYQQENFVDAQEAFEEALKENPASTEACLQLGKTFLQMEQLESSRTMLEWAVKNDPMNQTARLLLQKVTDAIDNGILSNEQEDLLLIAYNDFQKKDYSAALAKVLTLEQRESEKFASLLNFKGFVLMAQDSRDEAKAAFEKAKTVNAESSQAYAGLGELLYLEKNDYEAKKMFEIALRLNPDNHFAQGGLDKLAKQKPTPAVVKTANVIEPLIAESFQLFSNGDYIASLQKLEFAEKELRSRGDAEPVLMSRLLNFKGSILVKMQRWADGRKAFEEALTANPESSPACSGLGDVFVAENNYEAAKTMYEWALKLNPQNESAKQALESVLLHV